MKNQNLRKVIKFFAAGLCLFIAGISLTSCKKTSERKLRNEDIDTAIEYITQAYAPYDDAVKLGFDIKKARRTIKWKYIESKLAHKFRNHNHKEYKIVNGIDNWAMAWAVGQALMDFPVKDMHLRVWGIDNDSFWWTHEWAALSDIKFIRKGDDFVVYSSGVEGIKTGMKFTGDAENMQKTSGGRLELYRYIYFPKNYTREIEISLDNKNYTVPVFYNAPTAKASAQAGFAETKDTVYISLKDFSFKKDEEKNLFDEAEKEFYDVLEKVKACVLNKQNVIIDLRGNPGGFAGYGTELLASVFYGSNERKIKQFPALANNYDYGTLTLDSPVIVKRRYDEIMNSENYNEQEKNAIKEKYDYSLRNKTRSWDGLDKPVMTEIPKLDNTEFTGKIYILIDENSSSASEHTVALSFISKMNDVILVGMNSCGCIDFAGVYTYELPNSRVKISLAASDKRRTPIFSQNPHWKGDTKGFYPDYWASSSELLDTLINLTGDKELKKALKGLEKGQIQ